MLGGWGEDVMLMTASAVHGGCCLVDDQERSYFSVVRGGRCQGQGIGGEVFCFYISFVVVKWWLKIAEWHCIVP